MAQYSAAFEAAMALLDDPPEGMDLEAELVRLEKQIDPGERDRFGDLWSAFYTMTDEIPDDAGG